MVSEKSKKNLKNGKKFTKETASKAQARSVAVRNEEKDFLKAMKEWITNGRLKEEVEKSLADPAERKVIIPILVKKALPDNINLNATGSVKRDINIVFRKATPQDAK